MSVAVKICGLRTLEAVDAAVGAGAAYAGFVYYPPSPRHISICDAALLIRALPATVKPVMVTVNAADHLIEEITGALGSEILIQLHGNESVERLMRLRNRFSGIRLIKALAVASKYDIQASEPYMLCCDMLLFDAKPSADARLPGGNGVAFNWSILNNDYCKNLSSQVPWFLSGGLTPNNVQNAIRTSGAALVDVSSGVESAPGVKDAGLIHAFLDAVRK